MLNILRASGQVPSSRMKSGFLPGARATRSVTRAGFFSQAGNTT